jgi:triacylglycerol lipase
LRDEAHATVRTVLIEARRFAICRFEACCFETCRSMRPGTAPMIALRLQCILGAVAIAILAQYLAPRPIAGALGVIALFLALHMLATIVTFAISRRHAFKAPAEFQPGFAGTILIVLREWCAQIALFVFIQPVERAWLGDDRPQGSAPGTTPVLLVHGYMCNRGIWWWISRKLAARGFPVATVNLEPPRGDIEDFADQLHRRIESLCASTGAAKVALVSHSMGGLVARAYLRKHGTARVARLVTLAAPHRGTWLAYYGIGRNAREMEPDSEWIRAIAQADPGVPALSIWTPTDNFIAPQDSSRLAGAREKIVPASSHLAMLFSPQVCECLAAELAHEDDRQR